MRKKRGFIFILTALLLALVVPLISMPKTVAVFAENVSELLESLPQTKSFALEKQKDDYTPIETFEEADWDKTEIIAEDISKRTETSKTFVQADGTYVFQDYGTPVHYLENDEYVDIDNTLNAWLENNANSFKVKFGKENFSDNDKSLVEISDGAGIISMTPVSEDKEKADVKDFYVYDGKQELTRAVQSGKVQIPDKIEKNSSYRPEYESNLASGLDDLNFNNEKGALGEKLRNNLGKNNSSIYYPNLYESIDIQYILEGKSLKENIIINAPLEEYVFKFELNLENYKASQVGNEIFITNYLDETVYIIPQGYMFDAEGTCSYNVDYILEYDNESLSYFLTVTADKEFFETCVFPVVIDPSIQYSAASNFFKGRYHDASSWYNTSFAVGRVNIFLGIILGDMRNGFIQVINPEVSKIVNENELLSASLKVSYQENRNYSVALRNTADPSQLYNSSLLTLLDFTNNTSGKYITINVAYYLSNFLGSATVSITDLNLAIEIALTNPVLTINYNENFGDYNITQDLGNSGTGTVNLNTGKLNFIYEDAVTSDGFIPINISHIYDREFATSYNAGYGFKLNIQQRVIFDGNNYYYIDATGKKNYFTISTVPENKALGLKLYKNSSTGIIRLIDRQGNSMVFNASGDLIQMHQYPSRYESPINSLMLTIGYANGKISSITNSFSTLTFTYNSSGYLWKINNGSTLLMEYSYTGNKLTQAGKFFNETTPHLTTFGYDSNSRLTSISDANGDNVSYQYESTVSHLITSITTSNSYIQSSTKTVNISRVTSSNQTNITKTVILNLDNKYYRHVSFLKNKVISDYAFEKTSAYEFIPIDAWCNDFDYLSFIDTYANTRDVLFDDNFAPDSYSTSSVTRTASKTSSWPVTNGTHSYAASAWIRRASTNTPTFEATPNNDNTKKVTYYINNQTTEWQFVTIILKDITNLNSIKVVAGANLYIGFIRVMKLPEKLTENKAAEFNAEYNIKGQLTKFYKYNPLDNSITQFVYTYKTGVTAYTLPGSDTILYQYPGLVSTVTEYKAGATLTKAQFEAQKIKQSKTTYTYTDYNLTNMKIEGSSTNYNSVSYEYYTSGQEKGQLKSYTDENGVRTEYNYSNGIVSTKVIGATGSPDINRSETYNQGTGLLTSTTTGNITTSFGYNTNGSLSAVNNNDFSATFGYHNDGRLQSIGVPGKTLASYSYSQSADAITYGNNQSVSYNYNSDEYLTHTTNSDGSINTFEYNDSNQLSQITNSNGVQYRYYDEVDYNSTIYEVQNGNNIIALYGTYLNEAGHSYDDYILNGMFHNFYQYYYRADGQVSEIQGSYGNINYEYDNINRLNNKTTIYTGYSSNSNFKYNFGYKSDGFATSNLLENHNFLVNNVQTNGYTYQYYLNGNISQIYYNGSILVKYEYDEYDRIAVEYNYPDNLITYFYYTYGGNLEEKTTVSMITGAVMSHINYFHSNDWKDLLMSLSVNGSIYNITYDGAGNPLQYKGNTLTWKNGRQLANFVKQSSGLNVSYEYDYTGIRTKKTVNGITSDYFVEGSKILAEKIGSDFVWYFYDESGICGMKSLYDNINYFFEKNIFGDVVAIYNMQTAELIGTYAYDAWGNIISQTGTSPAAAEIMNKNPFRYRGYYYDKETELYYLNSRYYDPETGRFLNADDPTMLFETAGITGGTNLYAYCLNNPVMYTDSTGKGVITGLLIAGLICGLIFGSFEAGSQIAQNGWNPSDWDWGQIGTAFLGGFVCGAIAAIPPFKILLPSVWGKVLSYSGTFVRGGLGAVAGGVITGAVTDVNSGVFAFGLGGFANIVGRGAAELFSWFKAGKIANQSNKIKSLVIQQLQGNSSNMGAKALSSSFRNAFKGTSRSEIFKLIHKAKNTQHIMYSTFISSVLSGWY